MQNNRHLSSTQKENVRASISAAIYLVLIFALAQVWVHLSDTANAFITLH